MKTTPKSTAAGIWIIIITLFITDAASKSRSIDISRTTSGMTALSPDNIRALETRITPFLRSRLKRHHGEHSVRRQENSSLHSEFDLFLLAKAWNSLSPEFKELYLQSMQIPDSAEGYPSPGGHFEVFYFTSGQDGVDSTDTCGYSNADWRKKIAQPNGIPDYIDETAFALDSSWAMEVDRFGFLPPLVYKDSTHQSDRYKVLIEHQDDGFYGVTYLYQETSDAEKGFSSYISLRNTWNTPEWYDLGYDKHPLNGEKVTCAHEFFHAIQYSMCWKVINSIWLDNFPLTWTEGSAVSMEELAFDSVNDYHQYAPSYFNNPGMSFLNNDTSDKVYTNALLFLYLYRHSNGSDGIDFLKSMLFANYNEKNLPFYRNLLDAGSQNGESWSKRFHAFHCASFYTGTRADTAVFIADAADFPTLKISSLTIIDTIRWTMPANSGYFIRLPRNTGHSDTVQVDVTAAFDPDANIIVHEYPVFSVRLTGSGGDSIITLPLDSTQHGLLTITGWHHLDTLTVIATNGNPVEKPDVSLFIQPYPVIYAKGSVIKDTLVNSSSGSSALLRITAKNDLHAGYDFNVSSSCPDGSTGDDQHYLPVSACYSLTIPDFWYGNVSVELSIFSNVSGTADDSLALAAWNERAMQWTPLEKAVSNIHDSTSATDTVTGSGIYALVKKSDAVAENDETIDIFPNPVSLRRHNGTFSLRGSAISRICIYSLDGTLIYQMKKSSVTNAKQTYQLNFSEMNSSCSPGIYSAVVEHYTSSGSTRHTLRKKLLVVP